MVCVTFQGVRKYSQNNVRIKSPLPSVVIDESYVQGHCSVVSGRQVTYEVCGFLEKNNDLLYRDLSRAMYSCQHPMLQALFPEGQWGRIHLMQLGMYDVGCKRLSSIIKCNSLGVFCSSFW